MFADTWMPVIIFASRICDVSLGTLRVICVMRGQKLMAVVLGFFETLIWIFAVSGVFAHLHQVSNIVAYAAGFAAGNAVGMWIEAHLALGTQAISFVSRGTANAVAEGLRLADYFVTALSGCGKDGPVSICHAVVPRRHVPAAMRVARGVDPDVVITVEDIRECSSMAVRPYIAGKLPLALGRRPIAPPVHRGHDIQIERRGECPGQARGNGRALEGAFR
jgi:uncharacterized protein YebE (UPF0316 family)